MRANMTRCCCSRSVRPAGFGAGLGAAGLLLLAAGLLAAGLGFCVAAALRDAALWRLGLGAIVRPATTVAARSASVWASGLVLVVLAVIGLPSHSVAISGRAVSLSNKLSDIPGDIGHTSLMVLLS